MRMTLRQLTVFAAVAQEGTVTRASESVNLTQSAASMALADLEDGLGAPLFDRLGKRLQLNDLGRYLLPHALDILGRCESFEQVAKDGIPQIDLRLGATLTISDYLIPKIMTRFVADYPQAKLLLQVGNTKQIIDAVSQFQLDVGLIEGSCHLPQLQSIPWHEDELVVCCAKNHPLAKLDRPLTIDDFSNVEWILREQGSGTREIFDQIIQPDLQQTNIHFTLGHNETILKLIIDGLGCTCVSKLAVQSLVESNAIHCLNTPFWQLKRPLYLLVHRQKYQGFSLKSFMQFCLKDANLHD